MCSVFLDDLEKAKKKLKLSEVTSDVQTDTENEAVRPKRRAVRTNRYISSDDDDNPPPLKKHFAKRKCNANYIHLNLYTVCL